MSTKKYDLVIFIGRFQPFHIGHKHVLDTALNISNNVLVLIGSSFQPRTIKNPWTYAEREVNIYSTVSDVDKLRLSIYPLQDQLYNDQNWTSDVQRLVENNIRHKNIDSTRVAIIGHSKTDTGYYLKMFPQWDLIEHDMNESISATEIRSAYFENKNSKFIQLLVPTPVFLELQKFKTLSHFDSLSNEYQYMQKYKSAWSNSPYPPTFVTGDAVVVQSGHILLVTRKASPGKGLWALPGGFIAQDETILDGVIRELREETRLKVPIPVIRGSIKHSKIFDAPLRSLRGRTITQAFFIELAAGPLPPVKGGDDTDNAMWVPINEVSSEHMFEDHYDIITYFLGSA